MPDTDLRARGTDKYDVLHLRTILDDYTPVKNNNYADYNTISVDIQIIT